MKERGVQSYLKDLPGGYRHPYDGVPGMDLECGYSCGESFELDDPFEPFELDNHGLVGGSKTVDDFTPDGLEWKNPVGAEREEPRLTKESRY